jgi:small subunit ribosomal protein S4e
VRIKMSKKHLKRLSAPKNWFIPRKHGTWITRPNPGPHSKDQCLTLDHIVRTHFEYADTFKESKKAIKSGKILVDQKVVRDHKRPIGLMDVLSLVDQDYRVVFNKKGRLNLIKIPKEQAKLKLCKVINKTNLKGNKIQLNLHDGRNLLVKDNEIKSGDSIVLDLSSNKIKEHLKFDKGCSLYLVGGNHIGAVAFLEDIKSSEGLNPDLLIVKSEDNVFETLKKFAFVAGKSAPSLIISQPKVGGKKK